MRSQALEEALVSIHASAREATYAKKSRTARYKSFNPRLRAGGDQRDQIHTSMTD